MRLSAKFSCLLLAAILPLGCGHRSSIDRRVIHGDVTCGGESVSRGFVRFVPIENTAGPSTAARIIDGRYVADNRGGVPLGKHRVEISALRRTGKKVSSPEGFMIDETVPIGLQEYAGPQSPLTVEVAADDDGRRDFALP